MQDSDHLIDRLKQKYRLWKYRRSVKGAERAREKRIELEEEHDG